MEFWDAGHAAVIANKSLKPSLMQDVNCILFFCSLVDFNSAEYIEKQLASHQSLSAVKILVVTACDSHDRQVSESWLTQVTEEFNVNLCRIANFPVYESNGSAWRPSPDVIRLLNTISLLLIRSREDY